jgi:hypothetical protein
MTTADRILKAAENVACSEPGCSAEVICDVHATFALCASIALEADAEASPPGWTGDGSRERPLARVKKEPVSLDPLPKPYVWRTVNKREWPATGYQRHILAKKGLDTSLCSTTALPASVWVGVRGERENCPACVRRLNELHSVKS